MLKGYEQGNHTAPHRFAAATSGPIRQTLPPDPANNSRQRQAGRISSRSIYRYKTISSVGILKAALVVERGLLSAFQKINSLPGRDTMNILLGGFAAACLIIFISIVLKGIGAETLINGEALVIVVGGTVAALFVGFPLKRVSAALSDIADTFRQGRSREALAKEVVEVARIHRKHEVRTLEARARATGDPFLRLGITLLANHYKNDDIRAVMEREMALRVVDIHSSINVLKTLARLAPSFGLAGTVISLIRMFKNFQSFETMAPLMAVALMSTFYGVILSNLFLLPLSAKLKERATMSEAVMHMTIEGIVAVNNGEYPLKIEEKILGYTDTLNAEAGRGVGALSSLSTAS